MKKVKEMDYEVLLSKKRKNIEVQQRYIKESIRKEISDEKKYAFVCGMIDHLISLNTIMIKAETLLMSEVNTLKSINEIINQSMANKLEIIMDMLPSQGEEGE